MEPINFRPLGDRVLVRPTPEEDRTAGGIIIPDKNKTRPRRGTVVAVGPGAERQDGSLRPVGLSPGDRIVYGKYAGQDVVVGEDLLVMRVDEVIGLELGGGAPVAQASPLSEEYDQRVAKIGETVCGDFSGETR